MVTRQSGRRVVLGGFARLYGETIADALQQHREIGRAVVADDLDDVFVRMLAERADTVVLGSTGAADRETIRIAETVSALGWNTKVLVVTDTIDLDLVLRAERRGVDAIIPSDAPLHYLFAALDLEPPAELRARTEPADEPHLELIDDRAADLTPRETEVLRYLAEGLGAQAIADKADLSVHTVRDHIKKVLRKLAVHSQLEAVAAATRRGLV